jgi:hypothetical protein
LKKNALKMMARNTMGTETPIPALAPVERPPALGFGVILGDCEVEVPAMITSPM